MIGWTLFVNPMTISPSVVLWLLLPLCLGVAIVYKTVRTEDLRQLPRNVAFLFVYMICGLIALGGGLWLLQKFFLAV